MSVSCLLLTVSRSTVGLRFLPVCPAQSLISAGLLSLLVSYLCRSLISAGLLSLPVSYFCQSVPPSLISLPVSYLCRSLISASLLSLPVSHLSVTFSHCSLSVSCLCQSLVSNVWSAVFLQLRTQILFSCPVCSLSHVLTDLNGHTYLLSVFMCSVLLIIFPVARPVPNLLPVSWNRQCHRATLLTLTIIFHYL